MAVDGSDTHYTRRENMWDQQWPTESADATGHPAGELNNADELTPFPGEVGTTDVTESVRDAQTYTPPTDPPVLPGGREGIHVATGFGQSVEEAVGDNSLPQGDDDIRRAAMRILHQDSLASQLSLNVHVDQGVVRLIGRVQSIEDADHVANLLDQLPGVVEVIDDTTVE